MTPAQDEKDHAGARPGGTFLASVVTDQCVSSAPLSTLASRIHTLVVVGNAGAFAVAACSSGQAVPYHRLSDLEGRAAMETLDQL